MQKTVTAHFYAKTSGYGSTKGKIRKLSFSCLPTDDKENDMISCALSPETAYREMLLHRQDMDPWLVKQHLTFFDDFMKFHHSCGNRVVFGIFCPTYS